MNAAYPDIPRPLPLSDPGARWALFGRCCPFYANWLARHPDENAWLQARLEVPPLPLREQLDEVFFALSKEPGLESLKPLGRLRRLRRRFSMLLAYRELNQQCPPEALWQDHSTLADYCVQQVCRLSYARWAEKLGTPQNAPARRPARYAVIALGKLGGSELNFCSDVDLIFLFDADGPCLRGGLQSAVRGREFFNRMFREVATHLHERTADGFLYNVDLRLRPEGDAGPLVSTLESLTSYYWTAGQAWERLAWLRARTVAGDFALAEELLEELHPFCYPRFPPPHFKAAVAEVKLRTEQEAAGRGLMERDIKNGPGGIRALEFLVQSRQLMQGGANPFLQTRSIPVALVKLRRYGQLPAEQSRWLVDAYHWLRRLENLLQMRQESQTSLLPEAEDEWAALAEGMGLPDAAALRSLWKAVRALINQLYEPLFPGSAESVRIAAWSRFMAGEAAEGELAQDLQRWFRGAPEVESRLRLFVKGPGHHAVTREQVRLFLGLARQFDGLLPDLAEPLDALEAVGRFAECYGARREFFQATANPALLRTLATLFERSPFIEQLLCQHPGLVDELLQEAPRQQKSRARLNAELDFHENAKSRWLYLKAEQVRLAWGHLLHGLPFEHLQRSLSDLADVALERALRDADPSHQLLVVALGKYGSYELTLGSDLDLMVLAEDPTPSRLVPLVRHLQAFMHPPGVLQGAFQLDLRLRPYGADGPVVCTLPALRHYFRTGRAQPWERQVFTRARVVCGHPKLYDRFQQWCNVWQAGQGLPIAQARAILQVRLRVERSKTVPQASWRAFKAGPGGMLDAEFLAQMLALRYPARFLLRGSVQTLAVLDTAASNGILEVSKVRKLLEGYDLLRQLEFAVRLRGFRSLEQIPASEHDQRLLAHAMGHPDIQSLRRFVSETMHANRQNFFALLESGFALSPPKV